MLDEGINVKSGQSSPQWMGTSQDEGNSPIPVRHPKAVGSRIGIELVNWCFFVDSPSRFRLDSRQSSVRNRPARGEGDGCT